MAKQRDGRTLTERIEDWLMGDPVLPDSDVDSPRLSDDFFDENGKAERQFKKAWRKAETGEDPLAGIIEYEKAWEEDTPDSWFLHGVWPDKYPTPGSDGSES